MAYVERRYTEHCRLPQICRYRGVELRKERPAAADGIDVMIFNAEGQIISLHGHCDAAPFVAALTA